MAGYQRSSLFWLLVPNFVVNFVLLYLMQLDFKWNLGKVKIRSVHGGQISFQYAAGGGGGGLGALTCALHCTTVCLSVVLTFA